MELRYARKATLLTTNLDYPEWYDLLTPPLMKADPLLLSEADPLSARVDVGEAGR
jgi:hypothetical protein